MSVSSKKKRHTRRLAIRTGQSVENAHMKDPKMEQLFTTMDQITEKVIDDENKVGVQIFQTMKEWLKTNRNKKNQKKVFRDDRRKAKIATQQAEAKAKREANKARQEKKLAKKLQKVSQ